MTDHTHLYRYEAGTRCWCGEYHPLRDHMRPSNVIDLHSARQAAMPVQYPADVEPSGDDGRAG